MIEVDHGSFKVVPSEQPGDEHCPSYFVRPLEARQVTKLKAVAEYKPPSRRTTRFAHIFAAYDAQNQIIGYCALGRTELTLRHNTRAPMDGELIRKITRLASDRKQFAIVLMEEIGKEAAYIVDARNEQVSETQEMKMVMTHQFSPVHNQQGLF